MKHSLRARRAAAAAPRNELTAGFFRTLGHPVRVRVLEVLADGERPVGELLPRVGVEALASTELADLVGLARTVLAETLGHHADLLDNRHADADNNAASVAARMVVRSDRTVKHAVGGNL